MRALILRIIVPVAAALSIFAGLNLAVVIAGLPPALNDWGKTYDDWDAIYTRAVGAQRSGMRVVVFIGDSRVEWGIDAGAVQARLSAWSYENVGVFNLALPGRNVVSILERLNAAGFQPDILIVGYSHLSFYWSKNYVEVEPHELGWWQWDSVRVGSLVRRMVPVWGYQPEAIRSALIDGWRPPAVGFGSWLDEIVITPSGQARVSYKLSEEEAAGFQRESYAQMYEVPMSEAQIAATNARFLTEVEKVRAAGGTVLLLKMPLSDWARKMEDANEPSSLAALADYLGTPYLDGNSVPEAADLKTFDGLHLQPPDARVFSEAIAASLLRPNL
jgi:hypothetical protein